MSVVEKLKATRPTAVNLELAVERQLAAIGTAKGEDNNAVVKGFITLQTAEQLANEDASATSALASTALSLLKR